MTALLVDYENVIGPNNLPHLKRMISPVPDTNHTLGLVLVVPESTVVSLSALPPGPARISFLDEPPFVGSIKGFAYLICDADRGVCDISGLHGEGDVLEKVVEGAMSASPSDMFPDGSLLTIGADTKTPDLVSVLTRYSKAGFSDPYITKTSPFGVPYNPSGVCMSRLNQPVSRTQMSGDVKYVVEQFAKNDECCSVKIRFDRNTIAYLKKLSGAGSTVNADGSMSQKEIAGRLYVSSIDKDLVHTLSLDTTSTFSGKNEGVDVAPGTYNFHSHPKEAYLRHKVPYGWPSCQDYLGFVAAAYKHATVFHTVATVEGLYVVSFTECWTRDGKKEWDDDMTKFVKTNFNIKCKHGDSPEWYISKVQRLAYEGCPMFSIHFLTWKKAKNVVTMYYPRDGLNCFATEATHERYKKLQI